MIQEFPMAEAKITEYGKCALYEKPGDPLCPPVLALRGSDYDKGFAYGRLLAQRLTEQVSRICTVSYALYGGFAPDGKTTPTKAQIDAGRAFVVGRVKRDILPAAKLHAGQLLEELQGLYDGAKSTGSPLDMDDLTVMATSPESFDRPAGCSSFAAWGNATPDGRMIHGANQDFDTYGTLHKNIVVLAEEGAGAHTFLGPAYLGMLSAASFVNAAGLSYSEMTSASRPYAWPQIPHYWQAKLIAQSANSVETAFEIVQKTGGTTGWNLLVSETAEKRLAASIETVGDLAGLRLPTKQRPDRIYVTNHFLAYPGTDGYEGPDLVKAQFELFSTKKSAIRRLFGSEDVIWADIDTPEKWQALLHCARYDTYVSELDSAKGSIDENAAVAIQSMPPLCENGEQAAPETQYAPPFENLYGYQNPIVSQMLRSVYTCILKPEDGAICLAAGAAPAQAGPFYRYRIDRLI